MPSHMDILGSDHVVDYAVVTHPYPPRRHRNMLLGSNNTQMNIIEATPAVWVGDNCVVNHVITPEDINVGVYFVQYSAKWPKMGIYPLFLETFLN